jgi:hypothetical protein|tara:strand:- start:578 stop:1924 length:1347 start_codon:yes stop_codon:yes gene_type:complete
MFRYGGPIKEGVMSGIREPKKNGGPTGTGLVGDQRYPKTNGREHHAVFIPPLVAAGAGIARLAPIAMRGARAIRNLFAKPTAFQGPTGVVTPGKLVASQMKKPPRIASSGSYQGVKFTKTPTTVTGGATGGAPVTETALAPTGFGSYLEGTMTGSALKGLYKGATSAKAAGLTQKVGKGIWKVAKDPLTIVSAAYYFYPDGTPKPEEELEGPPPPGGLDKLLTDTGQNKVTGGGSEMSPKELRQSKIDKYRDIMDIKGMNKQAAYDSLIAASQAINESGDFKGDIKSGKLINQIIQSTSKAFDKPAQTKDAIDTLILKGEIEKDIKASDPANKILNEYRLKQMQKIDKDLETGFAEAKIAASKNLSGQSAIDAAASVASKNFKGNLLTKTQLTDVMEAAKGSGEISEQDIIISATQEVIKGKNLPDGDYTVGDVLVTITEGQVTNIKR